MLRACEIVEKVSMSDGTRQLGKVRELRDAIQGQPPALVG